MVMLNPSMDQGIYNWGQQRSLMNNYYGTAYNRNDPWQTIPQAAMGGSNAANGLQSQYFPSVMRNPAYDNAGANSNEGGFYNGQWMGGSNAGGSGGSGGNIGSMGDIFTDIRGAGSINFGNPQTGDFNPYQFAPSFQQFQRPDSPVAGLTPEEEFLRQYTMGQLLGPQEGYDTSMDTLMKTVRGDYLNQETNPYITQNINTLGKVSSDQFNSNINDILSRAGVSGALSGSRAALMQGEAAGDFTRDYNQTISDMLLKNYSAERSNQMQAIPGLLQAEQIPIQQSAQAMALAGVPREMQQKLIDAQMAEWQRMQSERMLPISVGQSIMGQRMGQTIPIVQPNQSMLQGAGGLMGGLGSLLQGGQQSGAFSGLGNLFSNFWGGDGTWQPAIEGGFDAWDAGGF